jgi:hypothetical protein
MLFCPVRSVQISSGQGTPTSIALQTPECYLGVHPSRRGTGNRGLGGPQRETVRGSDHKWKVFLMLHCHLISCSLFTQHRRRRRHFHKTRFLCLSTSSHCALTSRHVMVYLSLLGNNAYHKVSLCISVNQWRAHKLTLNIGNALLKDLVEGLGVLELLLDLGNDALESRTALASAERAVFCSVS